MNNSKRIDADFQVYYEFLKEHFPMYEVENEVLFEFYLYVHNTFILSDVLIDFEKIESSCNVYNIMVEYREFYARLLTTVAINDRFLVDNIFRVLIEKLYRLMYGIKNPNFTENKIRKKSRSDMSQNLYGTVSLLNLDDLDSLYKIFSKKIHHTVAMPEDYYNLTKRLEANSCFINDYLYNMEIIQRIFLEEVFMKVAPNSYNGETGYKKKIRNNTSDSVILKLGLSV